MGKVYKFRPRRKSGHRTPSRNARSGTHARTSKGLGPVQVMLAVLGVSIGGLLALGGLQWMGGEEFAGKAAMVGAIDCSSTRILDGDTFDCDGQRIRLHAIDAPELPGHCRPGRDCAPGDPYASTSNLTALVSGASVNCRKVDTDVYGRTVARCTAGDVDLSCAQLEGGFAIRRYGTIWC